MPPHTGVPKDEAFYLETRDLLEEAYLRAEDPRGGPGSRGDATWRELARRPIAAAMDRDGTFLDVGCANRFLMQGLVAWAGGDGRQIEPYGLDLIPSLATVARKRLPRWSDRIFVGDVMTWNAPSRFDFVRTELEYVPVRLRRGLVGRLIVCSYGNSHRPQPAAEPVGDVLRGSNHDVAGEAEARDTSGVMITRVAWTGVPHEA